jgi:NAD(P)H-hydrate epimerase
VLTPHPGEAGRLLGIPADEVQSGRPGAARALARLTGSVVVLKGHRTIVDDGTRRIVNRTGNPGMATGGTGDVLAGVIGALLAQGLAPFEAAVLGARVHGRAGDLAARDLGQVSLMATDLLDALPRAFRST